jgi:tRNA-Thr(GGU) m(6)t(6)A37 methyltransferase TsaA
MTYIMNPIGIIHTEFTERSGTPIQASRSDANGSVEIFSEFEEGLQDLEGFSHIFLLYVLHKSSGYALTVKPFLDDVLHGVFATRYPDRPNPIGLSVVGLIEVQRNRLEIKGVDMFDGTPLLDIKPCIGFRPRTNTQRLVHDRIESQKSENCMAQMQI